MSSSTVEISVTLCPSSLVLLPYQHVAQVCTLALGLRPQKDDDGLYGVDRTVNLKSRNATISYPQTGKPDPTLRKI